MHIKQKTRFLIKKFSLAVWAKVNGCIGANCTVVVQLRDAAKEQTKKKRW